MAKVNRSLNWMYNMEKFATQAYRTQAPAFPEQEISRLLKEAVLNEQQHVDNLRSRILELKGAPSRLGPLFQIAGASFASVTRLLGKQAVMKTDVWIERRAVRDYGSFLQKVAFDDKSSGPIARIIEDEKRHVENWEHSALLLKSGPSSR